LIAEVSKDYSVTIKYCCQKLELDVKRYQRWVRVCQKTGLYGGGKPGPEKAPHGLLPEEKGDIIRLAKDDTYADLSHRQLGVVASETGQVEASASSFYRVMKQEQLMEKRQRRPRTPQEKPEVKPTRPNEIWSWDLTYIALGPIFVYLFAIIDVYSRKIVGWHLGFNATVESMKNAWDKALANEGLIEVIGAPQMPIALSDHGVQMAKKSAKQFFKDLGIKQLFARYQTPKDNAWIESWFRILKYDWLQYKDYVSFDEIKEIIRQFVIIYNTQRYHGAIGYVTPEHKHSGKADEILEARTERKRLARLHRLKTNREQVSQTELAKAA
jgi:putative transposase